MSISVAFSQFVENLSISSSETISLRYGELTAALNKAFRSTESKTANTLRVGSFGRSTGIDGISDLDMLYVVPRSAWKTYQNGQLKLLQDTKASIEARYPATEIRVDRLVVTVTYSNFHVEVQPVFEQADGSFLYPDTSSGGSWKITKPRLEMEAVASLDESKNSNVRRLCKMTRAWKNKHGVSMGGLLIDTLVCNFFSATNTYDDKSYLYYDELVRDFFEYLGNLPKQERYSAPGSLQHVKVKTPFQAKAKKAKRLSDEAISAEGQKSYQRRWKKVFGRPFPAGSELTTDGKEIRKQAAWRDTEEFIEDKYPVDIQHALRIDCDVKQKGFREHRLLSLLAKRLPLLARKSLSFWILETDAPAESLVFWKVLNRGPEAQKRDQIRGQILPDAGHRKRTESTTFKGDHVVECYMVWHGVVVAKDRIYVPVSENA